MLISGCLGGGLPGCGWAASLTRACLRRPPLIITLAIGLRQAGSTPTVACSVADITHSKPDDASVSALLLFARRSSWCCFPVEGRRAGYLQRQRRPGIVHAGRDTSQW